MNNHSIKIGLKWSLFLFLTILFFQKNLAQNPLPGTAQTKAILLKNVTLHIGNGQVLANSSIMFDKGIITQIGQNINPTAQTEVQLLDGQHVYPGLISMGSQLGLTDIESIAATNDHTEMGSLNPNIRTLVAYNTDSDLIPTVRSNGILLSQAAPSGGFLCGQSTVFQLDGWNWQDAALKPDDGIWLNWPAIATRQFNAESQSVQLTKNEARTQPLADWHKILTDAQVYNPSNMPQNLKLEALKGLFDGTKVLYIRANEAKEIIEAVQTAQKYGIKKIAIVGGSHVLDCLQFIKDNNIPVILDNTHLSPSRPDDPVHQHYQLPTLLHRAGIHTVISYAGLGWRTRNLAYLAGTAAAFGLDKETALQMITLAPAQIMGIDKQVGSLQVGKHATLIVCPSDLLNMATSQPSQAYIQGRKVDLSSKHTQLNQRFSKNIKALNN
jgi:imidazolonepropionase-like amidohydrolase